MFIKKKLIENLFIFIITHMYLRYFSKQPLFKRDEEQSDFNLTF